MRTVDQRQSEINDTVQQMVEAAKNCITPATELECRRALYLLSLAGYRAVKEA